MTDVTEQELVQQAKAAISSCNWTVGECASLWTVRHARGRTDPDFGALVGLSGDQVNQRRRVWETWADVRDSYANLSWSHFYVAIPWDDSAECLAWADENHATVAELKAWRRMQHGEDLTVEAESQPWSSDPGSGDPVVTIGDVVSPPAPAEQPTTTAAISDVDARDQPYAPYRSGAMSVPADQTPRLDPEQAVKRVATAMERSHKMLSFVSGDDMSDVPEKVRLRMQSALANVIADARRLGLIEAEAEAVAA